MTSIFQRAATSLFRAGKYIRQHPIGVVVFLLFIFGAVYFYHEQTVDKHEVYGTNRLHDETKNTAYTIETYSSGGKLISRQHSVGVDINVSQTGNLSGGRRALMDTVVVINGADRMEVSGSTVVAFPDSVNDVLKRKDCNDTPIVNSVIKHIPEEKQYGSKLLLVKTYGEEPVFATYGREVKSYYSNIDNSQVFKIDGKLLFVFRGEFSISDTTIFSE